MKNLEYYKKILGIVGKYNKNSLRRAFYNNVKTNHPDKFMKNENKELATQKMKRINEAYEFLKEHINKQDNFSNFNDNFQKQESDNTYWNYNAHESYTVIHQDRYTEITELFLILVPLIILYILFLIRVFNSSYYILIISLIFSIPMYLGIIFMAIKFKSLKLLFWTVIHLIVLIFLIFFLHDNNPVLILFLLQPAWFYSKKFSQRLYS